MAKNQVTLTLAGDAKSLERAFDRAGVASKEMAEDFAEAGKRSKRAADGIDRAGDAAGNTEGKASGLADVMDGLNSAFGLGLERQVEYARAAGDVLGGFEQLKGVASGAVKNIGKVADKWGDAGKAAVGAKIQTVKTAAVQSAAWIKSSAQAMASAIKVRAAWIISMGPIALVVAAVAAAVFLIVKYWDEIKAAAKVVWEWVRDKFTALKDFFITWAPLLLGPIGLVIKEWDKLVAGATAVWAGIKAGWEAISGVPGAIVDFIRGGVTKALDGLATAGKVVGQAVWDAVKAAWEGVTGVADAITGMIRGGAVKALDGLAGAGKVVGQAVWDAIKAAWAGVTGVADAITSMIRGGVTDALEGITGTAGRIASAVWNGIKAAWAGVSAGITTMVTAPFKAAWNWIAGKVNAFKIPGVKILGKTVLPGFDPFPTMPTVHVGGIVPGPRGTEQAIMALAGERVLPPGRSGGGASYAITVNALDPQAAGAAVVRAIEEYERRNGQRFARA